MNTTFDIIEARLRDRNLSLVHSAKSDLVKLFVTEAILDKEKGALLSALDSEYWDCYYRAAIIDNVLALGDIPAARLWSLMTWIKKKETVEKVAGFIREIKRAEKAEKIGVHPANVSLDTLTTAVLAVYKENYDRIMTDYETEFDRIRGMTSANEKRKSLALDELRARFGPISGYQPLTAVELGSLCFEEESKLQARRGERQSQPSEKRIANAIEAHGAIVQQRHRLNHFGAPERRDFILTSADSLINDFRRHDQDKKANRLARAALETGAPVAPQVREHLVDSDYEEGDPDDDVVQEEN